MCSHDYRVLYSSFSSMFTSNRHAPALVVQEWQSCSLSVLVQVGFTTWPEAARRYLAATATATFLAQGELKSSATGSSAKELELAGGRIAGKCSGNGVLGC